jgi:uncharacterized protein YkwD
MLPTLLTSGRLIILSLLAVSTCSAAPDVCVTPQSPRVMSINFVISDEEASLIALTNKDRVAAGLPPLSVDPLLCSVARNHSADMAHRQYFDHVAPEPTPSTPLDRFVAALGSRPTSATVGENIYYRSVTDTIGNSSEQADAAFMKSPEHRANIIDPQFTSLGVGFHRDPSTGAFWVTEMFLRDQE